MNPDDLATMPLAEWDAFRGAQVTGARGPLSTVAVHPLSVALRSFAGVPGRWAHPRGADHVTLTSSAGAGISVDGSPVQGEVLLRPSQDIRFSPALTGSIGREAYGTYFLQVQDREADALRTFDHIERYPEDPTWILDAEYVPVDAFVDVGVATGPDDTHRREAPATVRFARGDDRHELVCMETFVPGMLMIVLTDATSGTETSAAGRSYLLPAGPARRVTLDMNRLMLMPHAFSPAVPCPIAPAANRLPFPVAAGERRAVFVPRAGPELG